MDQDFLNALPYACNVLPSLSVFSNSILAKHHQYQENPQLILVDLGSRCS